MISHAACFVAYALVWLPIRCARRKFTCMDGVAISEVVFGGNGQSPAAIGLSHEGEHSVTEFVVLRLRARISVALTGRGLRAVFAGRRRRLAAERN